MSAQTTERGLHWHRRWRWRRVELGFHLYKHVYPTSADRWVLQPFVVFDRAAS